MPSAAAYPINLDVRGRRCLVVGGGSIARGKVEGLVGAGALVDVVAPAVVEGIDGLSGVTVHRRPFAVADVEGRWLVVAATDDPAVNRAVFEAGEAHGVWVNAVDEPSSCSFTLPAVLRRGDLLVAVSTGGASPAFASWLRDRLASELGPEVDELLALVAGVRAELRERGVATAGLAWRDALDSGMLELVREGHLAQAKERLQACLSSSSA